MDPSSYAQNLVIMDQKHPAIYGYNPRQEDLYPIDSCKATLKNQDLFKQFHKLDTEMIITKTGRRMFPPIQIQLSNLDPKASYCVFLEMTLAAPCRFKYSSSVGWTPAGNEEAQSPHRLYMHPESPSTGEQWMSQHINFGRLKLTNSSSPPHGHVVLSSMHKYQPRILIVKSASPTGLGWAPMKTAVFPETQFIAVTAYQNEKITKLKIDHNPFAKGFRDNGKSSVNKRKVCHDDEDSGEKERIKSHECKRVPPVTNEEIEVEEVKMDRRSDNVNYNGATSCKISFNPCSVPSVYNNFPYPQQVPFSFYGHPLFITNTPFYYPMQMTRPEAQDLSMVHQHQEKQKKLTDFSIRAITGCS